MSEFAVGQVAGYGLAGVMASVIRRRETEEANAAYRRWCIRNAEVAALVMSETEPPMPAA